jgi:hypothetical protein
VQVFTTLVLLVSYLYSFAWRAAAASLVCNYGILGVLLRLRYVSQQAIA